MRLLALSTVLLLSLSSPAVAKIGDCGQPRTDGDSPTVADALHILGASLHGRDCPVGACDVDADCRVTPRDGRSSQVKGPREAMGSPETWRWRTGGRCCSRAPPSCWCGMPCRTA